MRESVDAAVGIADWFSEHPVSDIKMKIEIIFINRINLLHS